MDPGSTVFQVKHIAIDCCQINDSLVISKTSLMDPRFGPAWVAFGHTFALEGEHDHAVTAYSTCARMFTG
jgi:hypothetical protein